ncbi:MAG: MBL fold metallo-hydrolase [Clostridia bacterium]|nr:MBL fold metallo-hydrolase [Clostridia bacterium]
MELYTLGTSHGATEPGRACSSNLVTINGHGYLFDCGCSVESKMTDLGLPIDAVRAVFMSHMHEDHVGGLSAIIKRFVTYHPNAAPLQVYFPEQQAIDGFCGWLRSMHFPEGLNGRATFSAISTGVFYRDDHICVEAIPTAHLRNGALPSFAFSIQTAQKRLLFTGDLNADFHDFPAVALHERFDAVVCELVHFDLEKALQTLLSVQTDHLIFSHLSPYIIPRLEKLLPRFPFRVTVASDGARFPV